MKRLVRFINNNRYKVIALSILFVVFLILFITNSFAALTPTPSITVPSTTLSYSDKEEGAWQFTKTAKWISKGKAEINIKVNTLEKKRNDYTDVILVLDTSGSMIGEKLTQVQNDVNELIDDTIPKGNKIALITFNDTATIVNNFTDDASLLHDSINNLTVTGETNYYQALVKVDEVLSTYKKLDNKNCVVLFLTDGLPTVDTPLEIGEYKYLKSKYNYLTINGIQYESIGSSLHNITDIQYSANKDNLNEFLYRASLSTANYDKFTLTDVIDTNYFNLNNVVDITTTSGGAKVVDNQIIWNLDGLKSGAVAELIVDVNLNNDLIGVGGIYPTHTNTNVNYEIESTSTLESTTETTVLKDNYIVHYDMNTPQGCVVSTVPSSKTYSVFDTVKIDDSRPTCEGYQFSEWKIATKNVQKISSNKFIMPESDVKIKAIWKKLSVNKSSDGKISKVQTLYKLIADNSVGLDTNIKFNSNPTSADSGIYTIASTASDTYPVHYYRGIIDNNNVLFAGFCWKMVRTTSTGGVKLIYNGTPPASSMPISQDEYINVLNDATYPYTYDTSTNKWTSTNKTDSKTGTISFSVEKSGTYILSYAVSSEASWDKAYFYIDGTKVGEYSGTVSGTISLGELTSSNVIMVKYTKNSSGSSGTDTVTFSLGKPSGGIVKSCNNGTTHQMGTSKFNSNYSSPSDVGYMYGTRYPFSSYSATSSASVLNWNYISSSSKYYYGDSITYSNGTYTLQNAEEKSWSDNYSTLSGYYTCRSTSTACSTVYYIVATGSWAQYTLSLSGGVTDPTTQTITLGKGVTDNGDGTYSLKDIVTVKKVDWYSDHVGKYKGYYVCKNLTSTICDGKYPITSTSYYQITYENTVNYLYGNDVAWDGTKYTLTDTYTSLNTWSADRTTLAKKYHYTCLNTTGECTNVYYIHYFGNSSTIYYLTLSSGKDIEEAKNEMFTNTSDSTIKQSIDTWYKNNMTSYTDKLEDTVWCNDRTLYKGSIVSKDTDAEKSFSSFSTFNRKEETYTPSVKCPNNSRDGFTVSTLSGGNGALTYPVGLLTADEVLLAGGYESQSNNYLSNKENRYWTLSPAFFGEENEKYKVFKVYAFFGHSRGRFTTGDVGSSISADDLYAVRPSVSLAPGTKTTEGNGTVDDPYIVE